MTTDHEACMRNGIHRTPEILCEKPCTIYRISDDKGELLMKCYRVFPGIKLFYNSVHTGMCSDIAYDDEGAEELYELDYCTEGGMEYTVGDCPHSLMPGDLSIRRKGIEQNGLFFPSRHYHGISILVNTEEVPHCLSCFLDDIEVDPDALIRRLGCDREPFLCRSRSEIRHIFAEFHHIPDEIKKGYFKVKILELFLFLSVLQPEEKMKQPCSAAQVETFRTITEYLSTHIGEPLSVEGLAKTFYLSPTGLKNLFRSVSGLSVSRYIRTVKMQSAAYALVSSDRSVMEIAGEFGYENASKFSAAFCEIMGTSPSRYRKQMLHPHDR